MSWKFVVFLYFLIPMLLAALTYSVLYDLVGEFLSVVAGAIVGLLFVMAFLNMIGRPIWWNK